MPIVNQCEDAPCCGCCPSIDDMDDEDLRSDDEDAEEADATRDEAEPDDMDGDHASALASAGFGTDEDYGDWGASSMMEE